MLTARGWWLLIVAFALLFVGVLATHAALALIGLTIVLWFGAQALLFVVRATLATRRITLVREVSDDRGPVDALWAGRSFQVRVGLRVPRFLGIPYVAASDWVPFGVEFVEGEYAKDGPLTAEQPLEFDYRIRCPAVGRARFEGVRLRLSDPQGFFYFYAFVRAVKILRILPVLTDDRGKAVSTKLHNLLPPPGIHRLHRPGSGSELLDLRDYMPGDPPKTIAWKVSARRDKLITKEFESEVPLRCTLFVDTSASVRLGPPGKNALARVVEIAAGVAQANAGNRDLTGLCLFDDQRVHAVRPARTARHLTELLNILADAAGLAPAVGNTPAEPLVPLAFAFTKEVYPELLRPEVNAVPFWLPWLWPIPAEHSRPPSLTATLNRWLFWLLSLLPLGILVLVLAISIESTYELIPDPMFVPPVVLLTVEILGLVLFGPKILELSRSFLTMLFTSKERKQARWRKPLAAILSVRHDLGPGGIGRLLEDDELLGHHLQRFLAEHDVPCTPPLYDNRGRYQFAAPSKIGVLSRALLNTIGKGRDNELFVLLVDLLELEDQLNPLLSAVRVAMARHHQVMIICPWPRDVPPPSPGRDLAKSDKGPPPVMPATALGLMPILTETMTRHYHGAFQKVRQTFARLGVVVVCAAAGEPVALILERMDRLRLVGRRR